MAVAQQIAQFGGQFFNEAGYLIIRGVGGGGAGLRNPDRCGVATRWSHPYTNRASLIYPRGLVSIEVCGTICSRSFLCQTAVRPQHIELFRRMQTTVTTQNQESPMMITVLDARDDRYVFLTGLSISQFETLSRPSALFTKRRQQAYEVERTAGTRQPAQAGPKANCRHWRTNCCLCYITTKFPTFDVLGTQFKMARSKAHTNLYKLSAVLYATLVRLEMLPYREFKTPEDLKTALQGVEQIIIDATERAYRRPQDDATQREHYSGKKNAIR